MCIGVYTKRYCQVAHCSCMYCSLRYHDTASVRFLLFCTVAYTIKILPVCTLFICVLQFTLSRYCQCALSSFLYCSLHYQDTASGTLFMCVLQFTLSSYCQCAHCSYLYCSLHYQDTACVCIVHVCNVVETINILSLCALFICEL